LIRGELTPSGIKSLSLNSIPTGGLKTQKPDLILSLIIEFTLSLFVRLSNSAIPIFICSEKILAGSLFSKSWSGDLKMPPLAAKSSLKE